MAVRLDRTILTSEFEALKNYIRATRAITISGTIATGVTSFSSNVLLPVAGNTVDIYYLAPGVTYKKKLDNLARLTEYVGADNAFARVGYSTTSLTITIDINNSGAPYSAISQTFNFIIVLYIAPIT